MTAILERSHAIVLPQPTGPNPPSRRWIERPLWNRFRPLQVVVLALATIAPVVITTAVGAALVGLLSTESMIELALAAGENPGMITFGAMLLASPVQWVTGRTQVRVRKYLGIAFFLLAASNGAMFAIESGFAAAFSAPFLIAGTIALALATPLFLTSTRWSQRALGMAKWRRLHQLTYLVAAGLLAHVALIGGTGPGSVLITLAVGTRIPAVRRRLEAQGRSRASAR